jgi:hypothetical protein
MRSGYHNVPLVNGFEQKEGEQYKSSRASCSHSDRVSSLTLDIAKAYPAEAGIRSWNRTIRLERPDVILINDVYEVEEVRDRFYFHLMTPSIVTNDEDGKLTLKSRDLPGDKASGSGHVLYDADRFRVQVEDVPVNDDKLAGVWGDCLYRVRLRARDPRLKDSWRIRITR